MEPVRLVRGKGPQHRVQMAGGPDQWWNQQRVMAGRGRSLHLAMGARHRVVSGWVQAFWFPLPPPSFQCLDSSSTSLFSPPCLWAGPELSL